MILQSIMTSSSSSGMPDQTDESRTELAHSDKPGWLIRLYHKGITIRLRQKDMTSVHSVQNVKALFNIH